jgi:hypothetical protein
MMQMCKEKVAKYAIICIMLHFIKSVFFFLKTTLLYQIQFLIFYQKQKKLLYPLLCISNHLNQSKTFRKLKNEHTNKK